MKVGRGTKLTKFFVTWPHQVEIGECCRLEHHIYFHYDGIYKPGPAIRIGNHVFLGAGIEFNVRRRVSIGDYCLIAAGCKFIDHDHNISGVGPLPAVDGAEAEIILHDHVWLGANVVVLKGVAIGEGAVVAAGAVVTKAIPPNEIWAGVPARQIGARLETCP